eukprot:TRINITY_DN15445_c0_g1_i1.p1 TRINITY_DN15445_c0_g1~~TRINITY_DN15445_c0_g1_i1.p1  ORF type:complete len:121 (+),score=28.23 TRINITY_DN15445_c0_g1_i1:32-394(+)
MSHKVRVEVVKGTNLCVSDLGGSSDPYVQVRIGGVSKKTHSVQKELNPKWEEVLEFDDVDPDHHVLLNVFDYDRIGSDEPLGKAEILIKDLPVGQEVNKVLALQGVTHGKLEVNITVNDK